MKLPHNWAKVWFDPFDAHHCPIMKTKLATLAFCLLPLTLMAQLEDPHVTGNVPITFYGKVVDQSNQAVAGVKVRAEVRLGYFASPTIGKERWDPISIETDVAGKFGVSNVSGGFLQFTAIEKDGYEVSPKQAKAGFMYYPDHFQADPNSPVVFKMWKKQGAEPLVGSAWHGNVRCDGTLNAYDLASGKPAKGGNLEITCMRTPLDIVPRENKPYDYELKISVISGGIQMTEDEFTYIAPEGGYVPTLTLGAKAGDPKWSGNVKQEFYFKTDEGHYGKLSLEWYAYQTSPTHLEWACSINPSGSRNLER